MMTDVLKSIILDFQELRFPPSVPRRAQVVPVRGKATVCIGVRRSGKSTFMFQRIEALLAGGVARENTLYVNFFDDRLHGLDAGTLGLVTEAYFSIYPKKKGKERVYCFFDEIQVVSGWEPFVDRLMRSENCEVFLTGSSARMLSKEVATQMRGRALSWEIFPFSFSEFLDARGVDWQGALSTRKRLLVQQAFDEYWEVGGFPEVAVNGAAPGEPFAAMPPDLRMRTHQEYFHAVLYRDLIERHNVSNPKAVLDLARRMMENPASLYSINRLTEYLKSLGHSISKGTVGEYVQWFEDAYFLFSVRVFDASVARANTNPKKAYCVDHAMVRSVASGLLLNSGHLLENLVFNILRRRHEQVHYLKTRTGLEVDFVVAPRGKRRELVQVCETLVDPHTRARELKSLSAGMLELGITTALLVTRGETAEIEVEGGTVRVLPAWAFALEVEG